MKRKTHVWFQAIDFLTISYPYLLLAEVLMVSLGLTMFISTLYGHFFSYWDSSISLGPWETVAEDNEPEMSTSMQGVEFGKHQRSWDILILWKFHVAMEHFQGL
jgi:hypothetical protein